MKEEDKGRKEERGGGKQEKGKEEVGEGEKENRDVLMKQQQHFVKGHEQHKDTYHHPLPCTVLLMGENRVVAIRYIFTEV